MLIHYFITALRFVRKNKLNLILNLLGLSLGLTASFFILNYVLNETGYDRYHEKKKRTYRILNEKKDFSWTEPKTPYILSTYLKNDIPEIENVAVIGRLLYAQVEKENEFIRERSFSTATNEIFKIFTIPFIEGDPAGALTDPFSVVLTESAAEKYFPDGNALGKTLEVMNRQDIYTHTVTGIIEDFPKTSSFKADFIGNVELTLKSFENEAWSSNIRTAWHLDFLQTFILLRDGVKPDLAQKKIREIENMYMGADVHLEFHLQKLTDIYLHSSYLVNPGRIGNLQNIYLYSLLGIFIILIACFNYIILSIAQSTLRVKEIGIRKVVGASRWKIIKQINGESVMIAILAFPIALILEDVLLPKVNQLFRTQLEINFADNYVLLLLFILITFFVGISSGSYISFYLASFQPVDVFKNRFIKGRSKYFFQKFLVTIQILIFVSLISGTQIIFRQINYGKKKDLGFNKENLAVMQVARRQLTNSYEPFKQELLRNPNILSITGGMVIPPDNSKMVVTVPLKEDPDQQIPLEGMGVDFDFFNTLRLEIIKGRAFSKELPTDSGKFILNESAVKILGLENPIGEEIMNSEIIGVVKDFNVHSLHEKIAPLYINIIEPKYISNLIIKYCPRTYQNVLEFCKSKWEEFAPDTYMLCQQFEDTVGDLYYKEKQLGSIVGIFGFVAIIIASLGLFGLSFFMARQRTQEIGIRKVHGAQTFDILRLYGKDFLGLTFLANVISWPVIFYFLSKWLQNFAYQINIGIVIFLISALFSIIIVLATILTHSLKATNVNPVETLRDE